MVKQQEIQQISTFEERSDEDQMVLSQLSITEEITTSRSIEAVSSMCFYCLFGYIFNLYHLNLDSVDGNAANQLVDLPNFDLIFWMILFPILRSEVCFLETISEP